MGQFFSDRTEEGIRLVWMQFDPEKIREGQKLLLEEAENGDGDACAFLARTYMGHQWGIQSYSGLAESDEEADRWIQKGIELGSGCAILTAKRCGKLPAKLADEQPHLTLRKARDEVLEKAEAGHPFCQYMISNIYFWWDIFTIDDQNPWDLAKTEEEIDAIVQKQAKPWLERAVKAGLTCACGNLYQLYSGNKALPAEPQKVREMEEWAAKCGDPGWQGELAEDAYQEKDYVESLKWYEAAAKNGYPRYWFDVGYQYENGQGIEADQQKASECYRKAAEAGSSNGRLFYAEHLYFGEGVEKDPEKAVSLLRESQERALAWVLLGHCVYHGIGTKANRQAGANLIRLAYQKETSRMEDESSPYGNRYRAIIYLDYGRLCEAGLQSDGAKPDYNLAAACYQHALADTKDPGVIAEAQKELSKLKRNLFGKWVLKKG